MKYDFLLVGTGLFNAVFAYEAMRRGKKCIAIEKESHIGGNVYTKQIEGICVHAYGAHIFRTSDKGIWEYMQQFSEFNHFINSPIANYQGEIYNLPFNMNTFSKMWGIVTPRQAQNKIAQQSEGICLPAKNLEEHAMKMVGIDIYTKLIKGYTEKQWGKPCTELPPEIMRRIPLRFTYDNNYFNDPYQGIPKEGYTSIIKKMFSGCPIIYGKDFNKDREALQKTADTIIYTGPIDEYYDYCLGALEYRSLRFETEVLEEKNHQGVAVVNYTDSKTPYTRVIEHKHFMFGDQDKTVISKEYPVKWEIGMKPYYPINDKKNNERYRAYRELTPKSGQIHFGGRLGEYRYYDMQDTVRSALRLTKSLL